MINKIIDILNSETFHITNEEGCDFRVVEDSDFLDIAERIAKLFTKQVDGVSVPEWLTDDIRMLVKVTWYEHKDSSDNQAFDAMILLQRTALESGYTIDTKKALEILTQYCL